MEIVHSGATALPAAHNAEADPESEWGQLGGACRVYDDALPYISARYELLTHTQIANGYGNDEHDDYIVEASEERIEAAICVREDGGLPDGFTRVCRVEDYELHPDRGWRRMTKRHNERFTGWLVYKWPYVGDRTFAELRELSAELGGPVVAVGYYGSENQWDEHGLIYTPMREEIGRVNYNPRAITRRPYIAAGREYRRRLLPSFPSEVLHNLFECLHPSNWTHAHPFYGVLRGPELVTYGGWGSSSHNHFSVSQILEMRAASLKLWPGETWWRQHVRGTTIHADKFLGIVAQLLTNVHAVEANAKQVLVEGTEAAESVYQTLCEGQRGKTAKLKAKTGDHIVYEQVDDDEDDGEVTVAPKEDVIRDYLEAHHHRAQEELKFCRWLRTEARAMGVKMPKKPVPPISPTAKKKKRKKRKKRKKKAKS